jgi:RNA polymerase sigma-70 factor (ECF subfamily)
VRPPCDAELWRQAGLGEAAAFGVLFERYARAIYNYCFRRMGEWALAEDLTSVVFLEAWRRRATVVLAGDSALPWLYGVATNVVRSQRRAKRRYRAALARIPRDRPAEFAGDVEERLDDERAMRAVLEAVLKLPRAQRDVIALCVWSELSYQDAAVALGVPVGTVRSRLARARAALAELEDASGHELGDRCVPAKQGAGR